MRAVERTIQILEVLAGAENGVRLADICRLTGLDGSTALRFLNTLERLGYAARDPAGRRYRLGPRVGRLGDGPALSVLQRVVRPHMEALQRACGEDVNLGTMDAGAALCLETQKSSHVLGVNISSGLRMPAHASSLGKAMLAFVPAGKRRAVLAGMQLERCTPNTITDPGNLERELELVRRRGYATDREEFSPGVVCVGAPVFNAQGQVVASLSITAPVQRVPLGELERRYAALLVETCRTISQELGCQDPPLPPSGGTHPPG
ncbi:MAG: IclR family transcriptional regulator [Bacillota bacterium]|nr:IclR family transcriptional regulator [Bacillota bacterium]